MSSKFRVYDKQEKKYVDLKNNPMWMDNEGNFYFISDFPCCSCEGMSFYSDRYVVEFSTGKFDVEGKEIYKGDKLEASIGVNHSTAYEQNEIDKGLRSPHNRTPSFVDGTEKKQIFIVEDGVPEMSDISILQIQLKIIGNKHGEADDKI